LITLDEEAVERAVEGMTSYKDFTDTPQEFIDRVSRVDNYRYISVSKMIELHKENAIETEVSIKRRDRLTKS
jgi:hypothetical protein